MGSGAKAIVDVVDADVVLIAEIAVVDEEMEGVLAVDALEELLADGRPFDVQAATVMTAKPKTNVLRMDRFT